MHQEPGQSISDFYSQITCLWNQLALCEPERRDKDDASNYIVFCDSLCLAEFLTAIRDEFENTQASLLYRSPPNWGGPANLNGVANHSFFLFIIYLFLI